MRMINHMSLAMQISQRARANILRVVRQPLAIPQPLRRPVQPLRARQQLLPLLELHVPTARVVGIARAEERGTVMRQVLQAPLGGVGVSLVVAEALVYFRARGGGNVRFLEAHLVELDGG